MSSVNVGSKVQPVVKYQEKKHLGHICKLLHTVTFFIPESNFTLIFFQIIGPHYYEPECDDKKKCPDGHYCRMYVCVECHRSKHACTHREQCCNKMECVYGRCENKPKGSPGNMEWMLF